MASLESTQKSLSQEIGKFNTIQKSYQKVLQTRQQLEAQLTENNIVKEEMDLLEDDAVTYKLVGPALLKVDLKEAKDNVNSRIKYITDELKRHDASLQDLEQQQEKQREVISQVQQKLQQLQPKPSTVA